MQKVIIGILLFIIILLLFSGFFFFYEARFMSGRASVVSNSFSPDNSYVITVPSKAKGDGLQKIRVTVFILNGQGLGVLGKQVKIATPTNSNLVIGNTQPTTDSIGKAYFDVSAGSSGEYYLEVTVDGISLPQKAHVLFD